jgi:SAM-dependent methyltransferase
MSDFGAVGDAYGAYNEGVRGRLRHDLVADRILAELKGQTCRIVDVGCGDAAVTVRLAKAGHQVTGIDPSREMLTRAAQRLRAQAPEVRMRVDFHEGDLTALATFDSFDVVCCHGVLMYLSESGPAVELLADRCRGGGLISILTRNRQSVGFREALRGDLTGATKLIEAGASISMGNLGLETRADNPEELSALLARLGATPLPWQGIRVFSDHLSEESLSERDYDELRRLEEAASKRSPHRNVARLIHVLGRKSPPATPESADAL